MVKITKRVVVKPTVPPTVPPTVCPAVPYMDPIVKPTVNTAVKPAVFPVVKPAVFPVVKPAVFPVVKPVVSHAIKPAYRARSVEEHLWFIRECALCITGDWIDQYENWKRFVFALKNEMPGQDGCDLAIEIASRASRFPTGDGTAELWAVAEANGSIGAGSIIYWARECNSDAFRAVCSLRSIKFPDY